MPFLQEIEAVQTIVHAANEIKSNSKRVKSIITNLMVRTQLQRELKQKKSFTLIFGEHFAD